MNEPTGDECRISERDQTWVTHSDAINKAG
jgi:hypothetical protein